jgi:glutamate-ammonia-ligase adenylyltransferase
MDRSPQLSDSLRAEAESRWNEWRDAAQSAEVSVLDEASERLSAVFVLSEFVFRNACRHPEMLAGLAESGDLARAYQDGEYPERAAKSIQAAEDETALMAALRRFRRREMVRIAVRDLDGSADLAETTAELSSLAAACVSAALDRLHGWAVQSAGEPVDADGNPLRLVVFGMGKLGADELNFSSDVDLIFAYPRRGETRGDKPVPAEVFFTRLCRRLIHVIGANTEDGFVFRVDTNLRPFGEGGPVVMNFEAMADYYLEQGREWERYAWIKARPVAGDQAAGERLLERLTPFIYRRYLDYGVFENLREMKTMIAREVRRKGMDEDVKLGPGGIREVEFFGQIFQLLRGGVEPGLRKRRILAVLGELAAHGYIQKTVAENLRDAYVLLRRVENRLQAAADRQTHRLPNDAEGQARLAAAMGAPDWNAFQTELDRHRGAVSHHFGHLLGTDADAAESAPGEGLKRIWDDPGDTPENRNALSSAGFAEPEAVLDRLADFRGRLGEQPVGGDGRKRIDRLMPRLLTAVGGAEDSQIALDRILGLVDAVSRRTSYVALLLENPQAMDHLVRLADASAWILTFLARHPLLLDELLDPRTLYRPPERPALEEDLAGRMEPIEADDLEARMDAMRVFKQVNVLRVAAADITDAIPLMRVSDHLSDIAETVLERVVDTSWDHLTAVHGRPVCHEEFQPCGRGFAVVAYGKLGGLELSYGSDLDMVFLHAGAPGETQGGRRPVDTSVFFARLGQRVVHMLTAPTSAGKLYEADMRLRPSGSSGLLVCPVEAFRNYQMEEAWTWEKQALVRARPIAGDPAPRKRFLEIRREVLAQPRDADALRAEIARMRGRMRKELLKTRPDEFDLKQSPGGIVDIEFLVQYLVLKGAHRHPDALLRWTDTVRLLGALADVGLLDRETAHLLRAAYLVYRAVGHKLNLRERPGRVPAERFASLKAAVGQIWADHFDAPEDNAGRDRP